MKYAIGRTMSPMMIAEYKRLLVQEAVMKKSLEEYCAFMKQVDVKRQRKTKGMGESPASVQAPRAVAVTGCGEGVNVV